MSLYTTFSLLPPPPRHALSTLPELTRGRLPDFLLRADPAEALRQWTHKLYYIDLSSLWVHLYVITGCITALLFFEGIAIIAPRIRNKSFWLVRTLRKPDGVLWVPNSMMGFTLCAGVYGVLLVVWFPMLSRWFKHGDEPKTFWLFLLLCWLPLIGAAYLATLGLYHSLPPRFSFSVHQRTSMLCRPMVLNLFAFSLPLIQATTIIIPACIAHRKYLKSLQMYRAWQIKYASQAELSQSMVTGAQECWYALYPTFRLASLAFIIWTAWAALDAMCYIFLSIRLILVLRRQLKVSRKRAERHDTEVSPPFGSRPLVNSNPDSDATRDLGRVKIDCGDTSEPRSASVQDYSFFPKLSKAHIVHRQAPRVDTRDHLRYLRIVMYHVVVQLAGIGPGIVIYTLLAAYWAVHFPAAIETSQVDKPWSSCLKIPLLTAGYAAVVIGTVVLFSIAKRSYDYDPVGTQLRGLGEANAVKNSRGVSRTTGAGSAGAYASREKDGRNMTTFFESETVHGQTIHRPALAMPTMHEQDLERFSPVNQLGLDIGGSRRFSQTIIITEEPEFLESVREVNPEESTSEAPASPRSARFSLLRRLSGSTLAPEESVSRNRAHSDPASFLSSPSPTYRMRSLSRNSRSSKLNLV